MKRILITGAVAGILTGGGTQAIWGQHEGHGGGMPSMSSPSVPQIRTGKMKGKIVDVQQDSVTVQVEKKGKVTRHIYMVDSRTKTKGSPTVGAEATVKYREQMGAVTATDIEVSKPKNTRG